MSGLRTALLTAYAGHVFRYGCIIVLIPFYARVLGASEYGVVLTASALGGFIWIIQNWGFSVFGARAIAVAGTQACRQAELSRQLTARCFMLGFSVAIGVLGTYLSPILREDPVCGLLATAWGILAGTNLGWLFQGLGRFDTSVKAEVLGFGLNLVLALIFVGLMPDARMALLALSISAFISNMYAYIQAAKIFNIAMGSVKDGLRLIKNSFPFFLNTASGTLLATGGGYIVGVYASPSDVAYYGIPEKMVTTVLGLLGPASQVMLPWLAKVRSEGEGGAKYRNAQTVATVCVVAAGLGASLGAYFLSPLLVPLLFGVEYGPAIVVLQYFSPVFIIYAANHTMIVYRLLPAMREKEVGLVMASASILCIVLMLCVASPYGATGVALSRVAAELVVSMLLGCLLLWGAAGGRSYK